MQYTHSASHQAWYAAFNALFRPFKQFKCQLDNIPRAIYSDPEIVSLGLSEQQLLDEKIPHQVSFFPMDDIDRAITDEATAGFIKVITQGNSDKILGVCIVGEHGSELMAEFVLAKTHNLGLNKILQTVHLYPTRGEINRLVAGQWRQKKFTALQRKLLKQFQTWRLGR
jgi:pyruvate/2-oxoglutarate dehydrogenase complex dihydrolipoamide dehydrogenase (E3) component